MMDNLIDLDSDKGEQPGPSNVAAVNLPEFFIADPALWFVRAEAMFQAKRVKSNLTRYTYIVEHIPMMVVTQVRELLINPLRLTPTTSSRWQSTIIPSLAIAMNQPLAEQANLADWVKEMQRTHRSRRLQHLPTCPQCCRRFPKPMQSWPSDETQRYAEASPADHPVGEEHPLCAPTVPSEFQEYAGITTPLATCHNAAYLHAVSRRI